MTVLRPRCSGAIQWHNCPQSMRPAGLPISTTSEEAALGTAVHAHLSRWIKDGRDDAALDREVLSLGGQGWLLREQVQFGWDLWCERYAPRFPEPQVEQELQAIFVQEGLTLMLSGHPDVFSQGQDGLGWVLDWKTGRGHTDYWPQLRAYGWLLVNLLGLERIRAILVNVNTGQEEVREFSRDLLASWWACIVSEQEAIEPAYNPGEWCGYCPRAQECPARTQYLRQTLALVAPWALPLEADGRAHKLGLFWKVATAFENDIKAARQQVKVEVAAAGGSLDIGNGQRLVLVSEEREKVIPGRCWQLLERWLGTEALQALVSLGKGDLKTQVMARHPRGTKKAAWAEALAELRASGAVEDASFEKVVVLPKIALLEDRRDGDGGEGAAGQWPGADTAALSGTAPGQDVGECQQPRCSGGETAGARD